MGNLGGLRRQAAVTRPVDDRYRRRQPADINRASVRRRRDRVSGGGGGGSGIGDTEEANV